MNTVGSEEFPTSTSIMPFLKMFKPKRSRSYVPSERFSDDSELYDEVPAFGSLPNGTSGFNHSAPVNRSRSSQHYASSQTQHYPRHGSTLRSSGREQYAQPEVQDQSWYQVEHPNYHDGSQVDYYSEDGDRHSDAYAPAAVAHLISESSRVDSPVPTVYRQGEPSSSSRLYEQFATSAGPPQSAVTRVDLHEDVAAEGYEGFNRQRSTSTHSNPLSYHTSASHHSLPPAGLHRHSQRRPQHHAFQGPVHLNPTSESSRSDVVQKLENGRRITIPRHSVDKGRSRGANPERTYYIVPPGMNVIFRDEHGNELKRVGDFNNDAPYEYDEAPVEIADERGRIMYKTGENYVDADADAPKIVHLGQYLSNGSIAPPRSASPITVSLDRRGYHRRIQLDHSEDGSFGGSQGSDRSPSLHSHAHSDGSALPGHPHQPANYMHRSRLDQPRLRTIYP
jgi:hypothetical protein